MQKKLHIKIGDTVKVLSGESRGKEGTVLTIDRKKERATVSGVNIVKRHTKPSASEPNGGIVDKEGGIHISNLMVVVKGQASRIGRKADANGKLVRYSIKTGQEIK